MRQTGIVILSIVSSCVLAGCGQNTKSSASSVDSNIAESVEELKQTASVTPKELKTEAEDSESTMHIYAEADMLKDYNSIPLLLDGSSALVKIKVLEASSANVRSYMRSYIYTQYRVQVIETLQGSVSSDTITVNLPGGIIEGAAAQKMLTEIFAGKDAGETDHIRTIVSDGNTERMLQKDDTAYLFLKPEASGGYAVVGEYRGEILLEDGMVSIDSNVATDSGISSNLSKKAKSTTAKSGQQTGEYEIRESDFRALLEIPPP